MENSVDEMIKVLKKVSEMGCGGYVVSCNHEYMLETEELPEIVHVTERVEIQGY